MLTLRHVAALLAILATSACSSSSGAGAKSSDAGAGEGSSAAGQGATGDLCTDGNACTSRFCLLLTANSEDAGGLCSGGCRQTSDCGERAVCLAESARNAGRDDSSDGGGACYRLCGAGSDCAAGLPCIWQRPLDAGVCGPLRASFCGDLADVGGDAGADAGQCDSCLGVRCCGEVTACAEDVECSKLEIAPAHDSGNVASAAVAACAASSCAAECL